MLCGHALCEVIGGPCSLEIQRSRGCRTNITAREVAPEVFDEVRGLLDAIERRDETTRTAAVRLAAIIRREALDNRQLLAHARIDEPELAPALERLCMRSRSS